MDGPQSKALVQRGHEQLVQNICDIQAVVREYPLAKPKLMQLYNLLIEHLSRQDQEFYQRLQTANGDDRAVIKMLDFLVHDLKELKIAYLTFMDKHTAEVTDIQPHGFPKDFSDFSQLILTRIKIEEEYLFPLLDKLPNTAPG